MCKEGKAAREKQVKPTPRWNVDIVFSPAVCIHDITARTKKEAENIVNAMIDRNQICLTNDQIAGVICSLWENVDTIRAIRIKEEKCRKTKSTRRAK